MGENAKRPYISCIKINGLPILPPVITEELRKELLKYKHQAIRLEQRLRNCRELKRNLDELLEVPNENLRPSSQLTFGDNSHIEALNIFDKPKEQKECKKPSLSRDVIEVTQYDGSGVITVCSNITSEYKNFGEKDLCDSDKTDQYKSNDSKGAKNFDTSNIQVPYYVSSNGGNKSQCCDSEFHTSPSPPKPSLIRSNSYTLEGPSPILLAHLKKTSCLESKNTDSNSLASARIWTSLENNHTPFESSDFSSADTVYHKGDCDRHSEKSEPATSPDKSAKIFEVKSPTIEVYQTDISVQQITVNTTAGSGLTREEKSEKFLLKNPFEVFEPDCELLNVLKDIPETYANQIIELLRVQHLEQRERLERYDNLNGSPEKLELNSEVFRSQSSGERVPSSKMCDDLIDLTLKRHSEITIEPTVYNNGDSDRPHTTETRTGSDKYHLVKNNGDSYRPHTTASCTSSNKPSEKLRCSSTSSDKSHLVKNNEDSDRPHTSDSWSSSNKPSEKLRRSSTFSMSPSQSLYYSITSDTDSFTVPVSPSVKLIDLEGNNGDVEIGILREKDGYWEGVMLHENTKNMNCSRELFPEIDPITMNVIKKEWAASVIGAHIKGYLTRRLLKTEKVQSLIATIKDVLTCALELHRSDNIDEKDVELHRRLINQLSAALYAFHETFFDLSIPEQMLIIAADRQRRAEKLKRPQSARSLSRSMSNKSTNSNKSSKSLNSSRSSSKHKLISGSPSLTKV